MGSAQVAATDTNHGRSPRNSLSHLITPPGRVVFWRRSRRRTARRWTRGQESPPTRRRCEGAAPRSRSREGTPDAITMAPGTRTLLVALGFLSPPTTTFVVNRSGSDAEAEQSQSQHTWSLEIEIRSVPCVTAARAAMHRDSLAGAAVLSYCCSALPLLALQRAARGPVGATHIIK